MPSLPIRENRTQRGFDFLDSPVCDDPSVHEAFKKIGFLVANEIFMIPMALTAAMADLVLPAATFFEHEDIGLPNKMAFVELTGHLSTYLERQNQT